MIIADVKGNELLEIIPVGEEKADEQYAPVNHCLVCSRVAI